MFRESYCIQSVYLSKSRCNAEDKRKSGVDKEDKLNYVYDNKFWIPLDYEILKDHGAFFPRALCNELLFELKLAPVGSVVIRYEKAQLADELTTIQLEYEVIHNQELADEAFFQLQKWEEIHVRACDSSQDNLNS